ncbi:DUF6153 family protein [Streptomyces sp. TRM64462]|uniref:DUF6153 family protein n=1 Tax=Streptomyces sp. TRM64462 TaxID=2741726 RepID=UPI0015865BE4|nr:DUF6153 family protein [Streptomyces sp. TRM64462]
MVAGARGRCARSAARYGQLLLLAALLLGIVTMHTWGHPSEHAGTHSVAAPAAGAGHSGHPAAHGTRVHDAPEDAPPGGMDAAAICFALLGSAGVGLGALALLRLPCRARRGRGTASGTGRGAARVVRPQWPPPPRLRVALAELSVLRI